MMLYLDNRYLSDFEELKQLCQGELSSTRGVGIELLESFFDGRLADFLRDCGKGKLADRLPQIPENIDEISSATKVLKSLQVVILEQQTNGIEFHPFDPRGLVKCECYSVDTRGASELIEGKLFTNACKNLEFVIDKGNNFQNEKLVIELKNKTSQICVYQGQWNLNAQEQKFRFNLPCGEVDTEGKLELTINGFSFLQVEKSSAATDETFTVNGVNFKMIFVEGGTFTMGATSEQENDAYDDEKPAHQVALSGYYMGETEVTQALWEAVMGSNPSCFEGADRPVEEVSWDDAQKFIQKLNKLTGKTFRLPTEAEWEYAARGGNKSKGYKYAGSNSIRDVAWYDGNSGNKTHPVKGKRANELGLYDMSGNVWEWCRDRYGSYSSSSQTNPTGAYRGSRRVRRGGSWYDDAGFCRSTFRGIITPGNRNNNLGFRLSLSK